MTLGFRSAQAQKPSRFLAYFSLGSPTDAFTGLVKRRWRPQKSPQAPRSKSKASFRTGRRNLVSDKMAAYNKGSMQFFKITTAVLTSNLVRKQVEHYTKRAEANAAIERIFRQSLLLLVILRLA